MNFGRTHVVDILRIIRAMLCLARTDELARLKDDLADTALPHARVFAAGRAHAVHHDARHGFHPILALAARFALDEAREQLPVGIGHVDLLPHFFFPASLCASRAHGNRDTQKKAPKAVLLSVLLLCSVFFVRRRKLFRFRRRCAVGALHLELLPLLLGDKQLAGLRALELAHDAARLHLVDDARRARIAEL